MISFFFKQKTAYDKLISDWISNVCSSDLAFWDYMLRCRDGSYYMGHTDHLDYRMGQHQTGEIPGYTATRRPVELVWSAEFTTRFEALEAERQIKGWSRAKKEALIRSD